MNAPNKFIQDYLEPVKGKCDFNVAHIIKYLQYLIMAVLSCAAGTIDLISGSLIVILLKQGAFCALFDHNTVKNRISWSPLLKGFKEVI